MEDWAEVHRLFHREGMAKAAIARRLGMSRNTVDRLLALREPPRYVRVSTGSCLDPFRERIAAMLATDPTVRATVIRERLRPAGYTGGITILKDHLARVRPGFLAARAFQRTTYAPGEIGQVDWWHTGAQVPVGRGRTREAFGLVTTLPFSAAHAITFTLSRTVGDLRPALLGCLVRLGGVPEKLVFDNDASVVATGSGSRARLHDEVTGLLGALRTKPVVLRPARPTSKGNVERTIGYAETSFLPLREFSSLEDLQGQHDAWATDVAYRRHIRRLGARVERPIRGRAWVPRGDPGSRPRHGPAHRGPGGQGRLRAGARRRLLGAAGVRRPADRDPGGAHPRAPHLRGHRDRVAPAELRPGRCRARPRAWAGDPARPGGRRPAAHRRRRAAGRRSRLIRRAVGGRGMTETATAELGYLSRALKAPRIKAVSARLAARARDEGWDYEAYLAAVLAEEVSARDSHGGSARVKAARFPATKTLDDFDFTIQTSVSRQVIAHLAQLDFLAEAQNVVFLGPPGTGKTHLSIALGVQAARRGHRVAFATAHQWVNRLGAAKRAGRLDEELERLGRIPLLIVDEVGYIPFDPEAAALFFALISSRYERRSLIVSSNKTFSAWAEIFGDPVAVAAMVDRLVHHAEVIVLKGDSYRLRGKREEVLTAHKER